MKKLVIFSILVAALVLSAVNPWPAVLRVYNQTGDNVYFRLTYRGEQKYFLTATNVGNSADYHWSVFEVARKKYKAEVTACEVTATGDMDLNQNLKLTFVDCALMRQVKGYWGWTEGVDNNGHDYMYWRPMAFWGEPGMEKPNFYQHWDTWKEIGSFCPDPTDGWCDYKTHKLGWVKWYFQYDLPADFVKDVTFYIVWP